MFREVKAATVAYLQEFLVNLDRRGQTVAAAVARVEERGVAVLHERALRGRRAAAGRRRGSRRRLAGAPPGTLGGPAGVVPARRRGTPPGRAAARRRPAGHRLAPAGPRPDHRVTTPLLQRRPGLPGAGALVRRRPGEDDLHRLWSAAFGLGPARHAHLAHPDPELIPSSRSWAEAPPVEVSALLRTSGRTERFTRTGKVRDVAAVKAARAERARAERAELARGLAGAWRRTDPCGSPPSASWTPPSSSGLLDLLGRALSARPDAGGLRRAATADGRVEIAPGSASRRPDRPCCARATGSLAGPDYLVHITERGRVHRVPGPPRRTAGGSGMSTLANQLVVAEREEVARGIRLLLARPLITEAATRPAFELVRRRRNRWPSGSTTPAAGAWWWSPAAVTPGCKVRADRGRLPPRPQGCVPAGPRSTAGAMCCCASPRPSCCRCR